MSYDPDDLDTPANTEDIVEAGRKRIEREDRERRERREAFVEETAARAGQIVRAEAVIRAADHLFDVYPLEVACEQRELPCDCIDCAARSKYTVARARYRLGKTTETKADGSADGQHSVVNPSDGESRHGR